MVFIECTFHCRLRLEIRQPFRCFHSCPRRGTRLPHGRRALLLLSIVQGNLLLLLSTCCLMSIVQGDLLAPRDLADCAPRLDGLHGEHRDAGQ